MKSIKNKLVLSAAAALLVSTTAFADNSSEIAELKKQIEMLMKKTQELESKSIAQAKKSAVLEEKSQMLIDETSDLKTGFNYTTVDTEKSFSGLGAAASKVYYSKSPLSIGGYGEMYYSHTSKSGATNKSQVDVYRFVPYIGYKFTDNIILNVELEFEHGGVEAGDGGEIIVEFMYLDFLFNENVNLRVGHMLMPMGLINERHEPTLFNTVQRPNTSKYLIPSTWHESGVMVFGEIAEGFQYKLAGVTALDSTNTGDKWIRNGRGGSFKNTGEDGQGPDLGVAARIDYTGTNGLLLGASVYSDSNIDMWDIHADYKIGGFRTYGVYTQTTRDNEATPTGAATDAEGGFINFSYDMFSLMGGTTQQLPLFVQFESTSPQEDLLGGGNVDSIDTTTIGINYFPHEQVVLKLDYAMKDERNGINTDEDTISASLGFIF